ncbi:TadE family type IV pilus minor pilin [Myceligenerans salitolerans]|uniref:Pilus assembly protein n=1 Tax=Myceligenerans salitolerans TaxID=1230528 RepID=A0ABS3I9J4_9MICO|nr:TadE family type IV pilus minor pilin [Myceligenerans salitolerans]MBO0609624.1 pilus assembly protein [Myceligenerans salitolerans]
MTANREEERGTVTAELAVALPAVVLVLVAVLTLVAASMAQMRAVDAARAGARAAAIGDEDAAVARAVARVGGDDVDLAVEREGEWVHVTVTKPVVNGWASAGPLRARATATAWIEP